MHGVVMRDNNIIIFRVLTFCGSTPSSFRALVKKAAEGLPITWAVSPVAYCWEGEDRVIKTITQHKPHWLFIAYFHSLHEWSNIQCQFRAVLVVSTAAKQNIYSTVYDEGNLSLKININFDIYKYNNYVVCQSWIPRALVEWQPYPWPSEMSVPFSFRLMRILKAWLRVL